MSAGQRTVMSAQRVRCVGRVRSIKTAGPRVEEGGFWTGAIAHTPIGTRSAAAS